MGLQEFPSKPVNKGGIIVGTVNGPTEIAVGAQDGYLAVDSTTTPGVKWKPSLAYNVVQLTSGTSWTVPATVTTIDVLVIGGGGGSPGISSSATANTGRQGQGGAAGALVYQRNYPVTPGASITYSIGSGQAGGTNPAPTAGTDNWPAGAAGNTTFGSIIVPGATNKVGTRYGYTAAASNWYRGTYDVDDQQNSSPQSQSATTIPGSAGMPFDLDSQVLSSIAIGTTSANTYSHMFPRTGSGTSIQTERYYGISNTYSKLLSTVTAPTGATATQELTAALQLSGWAGYGGYGRSATSGSATYLTFHGGGQGASINTSTTGTNRTLQGGAAGANSGSGGGGSAVFTASTTVVGVAGAAGGSGVIFIGYWA